MYGKLFESTFSGSMVGSGSDTFAVWAYVLAHQRGGTVELNPVIIGAIIGMEPEKAEKTIEALCAPDPRSRNKEHEGRRLIREGQFLYTVTGYPIYSKILNEADRREYFKIKKRESRARVKESTPVKDKSTKVNASTHSDADLEASVSKKSTSSHPSPNGSGAVEEVVAHYVSRRPKRRPGNKERACIEARFKEGMSVSDLKEAIDGALKAPFTNEQGKVFDSLELIVRNSAKVNQYRAMLEAPPPKEQRPYGQGVSRGELPSAKNYSPWG